MSSIVFGGPVRGSIISAAGDDVDVIRTVTSVPAAVGFSKAWFTVKTQVTAPDPGLLQKVITTTSVASAGQLWPTGGAFVQAVTYALDIEPASNPIPAFAKPVAVGDVIVVIVDYGDPTFAMVSVTDTLGTNYTKRQDFTSAGRTTIWTGVTIASGTPTLTVLLASSNVHLRVIALHYTNITGFALDGAVATADSIPGSVTAQSPNLIPGTAGDLILSFLDLDTGGAIGVTNVPGTNATWVQRATAVVTPGSGSLASVADYGEANAGPIAALWTLGLSSSWIAHVMAIKTVNPGTAGLLFRLTSADTLALGAGTYTYDIQALTDSGKVYTLELGQLVLANRITAGVS